MNSFIYKNIVKIAYFWYKSFRLSWNLMKAIILKIPFLVLFALSYIVDIKAQENYKGTNIYFSPRITIGYTIGSGLNYGFDLVMGLYQLNDVKFGIDFTYYMINTDQGHHRIKGFALMAETDYLNVKLGAGSVSRRWGLKNVNKAKAPGIMIDVSGGIDPYKAPWIGAKGFIFNRAKWSFYDQPSYISAYTYFKTREIEIFKDEEVPAGQ